MQILVWIIRFVIIVVLVWFAVRNSQQIDVYGLPGQVWQAPLVFVLLVVFIGGVAIGLLAWIPTVMRQSREIGRLRKAAAKAAAASLPPSAPGEPSGTDIHGI